MVYFGLEVNAITFLIIPYVLIFAIFILGFGLILAALNVYLRDVAILWNTLNPALFYISPIVYTADFVPPKYLWVLKLNPLYHYFEGIRSILYYNHLPTAENLLMVAGMSALMLLIGGAMLKKLEPGLISNL